MSDTSQYQRFAWLVDHIKTIRARENYVEFSFPPNTPGVKEVLEELMRVQLPALKQTTFCCVFSNSHFFDWLWREYNNSDKAKTEFCGIYRVQFKFDMGADALEEASGIEEYYAQTLASMEDGRLNEQMAAAISWEHFEHAALIRDEIAKRQPLPRIEPLKWRPH